MILIRCKKCKRFYSNKHSKCTNCGNKDSQKDYYVRLNNKDTYAGNSLTVANEINNDIKKAKRRDHLQEFYDKPEKLSFDTFINDYFTPHFQAKNKRYDKVQYSLTYFCDILGDKELSKIDTFDIEKAINKKGQERTPRTRNYYLSVIKRIFNYAIEIGKIKISPVKTKPLKLDNKRMRFLTTEEQDLLIAECKQSPTPYLLPMVMIALYTGMRKGEIQQLVPENIRDGKIYLHGDMTKSSEGRIIPIHQAIVEYLSGEFKYNHDVKRSFVTACTKANISNFRFHDLRHTFASHLVQSGVDLYTVKELLGHASIEMTQRYAHLAPDNHLKAIEKLK